MFIIRINQLQGVELILRALRGSGCIASSDLADGIEKTLVFVDTAGAITACVPDGVTTPVRPNLTVVKTSGRLQ
jgi:hypothetical protein